MRDLLAEPSAKPNGGLVNLLIVSSVANGAVLFVRAFRLREHKRVFSYSGISRLLKTGV